MRPTIDTWFERFLSEHLARHQDNVRLPDRLSDQGKVVYASWHRLLGQIKGLDLVAMTAASERLLEEPATDRKHFTSLATFAREALLDRRSEGQRADLGTREGAELASKGCERCGGTGLTTVWLRPPIPERTSPTAAAHCACALGRWKRAWWLKRDQVMARRWVDLDDVLNGRSAWLADPPSPVSHPSESSPF